MTQILIDSLLHQPIPHTPIWLMRQAGRYLPEYREIRSHAGSFMNLCTNPELACKVTLQPLQRFNLDAAILFSDILVIPDAMGLGLHFVENEGPKFLNPITTNNDIDNLQIVNLIDKLDYVFKTIKNVKAELKPHIPLIGFSGSPFTLACYMLEGGSSNNYLTVKKWLINNPVYSHKLLNKITEAVIIYLNAQIEAGVDVVMLFDSWGGVLTENAYLEFSLPYLHRIVNTITKKHHNRIIPNILFTKGGGLWLKHMAKINTNVIGLDWTINIATARELVPHIGLQGNLDPVILAVGDKSAIRKEVSNILNAYATANNGNITGHVFNLGHGILPMTNPDNVAYLVELVHELSAKIL